MKNSLFAFTMLSILSFTACEKPEVPSLELESQKLAKAGLPDPAAREFYDLDNEVSVVEWKGAGPGTVHDGSFSVTGQDIEIVNGKVKEGKFVIPIASIQNFDLPEEVKPVLLDHLKSPDFFNMVRYPEATFEFKKVTPITKPVTGSLQGANFNVTGDFSMLGKVVSITFPAKITTEGNELSAEAIFKIDRTRWGMTYAADPALGDHHIYPEVELHLKIKGQKQ